MTKSLTAVFDGEVLRPESPVDLQRNVRYRLTLEQEAQATAQSAWDVLDQLTGAVEEPEDWATEHDHYLYGTPKRRSLPLS